jgi:hypothetical protein
MSPIVNKQVFQGLHNKCGDKTMKNILIVSVVASLVLVAGPSAVSAQDNLGRVIPVELFACTYNDGQDASNLDKVVDKWNKWADKTGLDDYAAWTLTPFYFGPDQEFDVIWLGAGKDAVALGKAQDDYNAENAGLHAAFDEVLSCNAHINFASLNYKALPDGATPSNSVLTFSDCKYKDGASFSKLATAMGEWSQHLNDKGSSSAIFHWYPVYGGGGEEFDFKWIEAFKNLTELGVDFETMGNGGSYATNGKLMGHLVDCDSSRAYLANNRRFAQLR